MKWIKLLLMAGFIVNGYALSAAARDNGDARTYDEYSERVEEGAILPDREEEPGDGYVHVEAFPLSVSVGVPGFWRMTVRPGFAWVDGRWEGEYYIPGYYRPVHDRGRNWAWAPGHWGGDRWIPGHWRPSRRDGFAWIEGHWTRDGEWIEGYWRPLAAPPRGMVWEPGYWSARGWVEGFWRLEVKPGFFWIGGDWDDHGSWICGRWEKGLEHNVWERRYWDRRDNHWHPGRVVKLPNVHSGAHRHGFYNPHGEWVSPYEKGVNYGDRYEERRPVRDVRHSERGGEHEQTDNYRRSREAHPSEQEQLNNYRQSREPRPSEAEQVNSYQRNRGNSGGQVQKLNTYQAPNNSSSQESNRYQTQQKSGTQEKINRAPVPLATGSSAAPGNGSEQEQQEKYRQSQNER